MTVWYAEAYAPAYRIVIQYDPEYQTVIHNATAYQTIIQYVPEYQTVVHNATAYQTIIQYVPEYQTVVHNAYWMTVWYADAYAPEYHTVIQCALHTRQSSTQNKKYPMSHKHSCFS